VTLFPVTGAERPAFRAGAAIFWKQGHALLGSWSRYFDVDGGPAALATRDIEVSGLLEKPGPG